MHFWVVVLPVVRCDARIVGTNSMCRSFFLLYLKGRAKTEVKQFRCGLRWRSEVLGDRRKSTLDVGMDDEEQESSHVVAPLAARAYPTPCEISYRSNHLNVHFTTHITPKMCKNNFRRVCPIFRVQVCVCPTVRPDVAELPPRPCQHVVPEFRGR